MKNNVSDKFNIINSSKVYWQLKKYGTTAKNITDLEKRKAYMAENKEIFDKLKFAVDVMNRAKDEYGYLPKAQELYAEIEAINSDKDTLIEKNKLTKKEKEKWENVRYNLINVISPEKIEEKQDEHIKKKTRSYNQLR